MLRVRTYIKQAKLFIVRGAIGALIVCAVLVLSQPLQVFPGAFDPGLAKFEVNQLAESIFVTTSDNKSLEIWRLSPPSPKGVAIIFHGNAGTVSNFFPYQSWAASNGLTSYGFDYRGYGRSSGFPTESGLYLDSDAVLDYVVKREKIPPSEIIPIGISIGTGPAAYFAAKARSRIVLMFTAYTSLPDVARTLPVFGYLAPFLWYNFPVKSYLSSLNDSCIVLAHGERDEVIPFTLGLELYDALRERNRVTLIRPENCGHNDILFKANKDMSKALQACLTIRNSVQDPALFIDP